jgi:hypothetical protein
MRFFAIGIEGSDGVLDGAAMFGRIRHGTARRRQPSRPIHSE